MVRDVFRLAKENAPAIIFIDEVDAIATARFDAQTGADREVQRILMELLNQVKAWSTMTSALDLLFLILLNIVAFKNGLFRLTSKVPVLTPWVNFRCTPNNIGCIV